MLLDDALTISDNRELTGDELSRLINPDVPFAARADALALDVAERFLSGATTFRAADGLLNQLFSHATLVEGSVPEFMNQVFLAFDEGEYHHDSDDRSVDPVEKYTRPSLTTLLSSRRA